MRPRSAVHDDPDQVASLTADTIRVKLTDNQGGVSFETYVVNLANLNDNAPEFSAPVAGTGAALEAGGDGTTASPYQITGFDENLADGTTVFTPATTDADDVDGGVTDTVEYSLASGVADNDLFTIDAAAGAVSFNAGEADYERPVGMTDGTYRVEVTATNADASPVPTATGATKPSSTQVVEIVLNNIDEAPTRIFLSIYIQAKEAGETGTFGSTTINYNKISFVLGSSPVDGGTGTPSFVDTGDGNWRATINYDVTGNDATTVQDVVDAINDHGDLSQIVEAFYKTPDGETAAVKLSGGTSVSGSYTIDDEDTTDTLDAHTLTLQVREGTNGVYTDVTSGG